MCITSLLLQMFTIILFWGVWMLFNDTWSQLGHMVSWIKQCKNVNADVYSLKSPWIQQTLQFTPLVLQFSLIWSHLLWAEFSAFSAANAIHKFPIFHSTSYPLLLGGQRQYGMRSLPDTSTHDQQWESNPRYPYYLRCLQITRVDIRPR